MYGNPKERMHPTWSPGFIYVLYRNGGDCIVRPQGSTTRIAYKRLNLRNMLGFLNIAGQRENLPTLEMLCSQWGITSNEGELKLTYHFHARKKPYAQITADKRSFVYCGSVRIPVYLPKERKKG